MPVYAFEALSPEGEARRGVMEADSAHAARSQLRAQGLVPLQVAPAMAADAASSPGRASVVRRRVFSAVALGIWTRQLAGLVAAGLPLERALSSLAEEAPTGPQRLLVAGLRAEVNAGAPFARALAQYPREFSDTYVAVVGAGEQSGQLGTVLERLADDLEQQQTLRARLIGAALYPAIVTGVALCIVLFLVTYVVPQVAQVFVGSKQALPWLTVLLLALSDGVRQQGGLLLLLALAASLGLRLALARPLLRERFDAYWLRLPLLGRLALGYNTARFAGTLAMLSGAGVPILKALQAATDTLSNRALRRDAEAALVSVREGAPLASALAQHPRFPPLLALFARLGEQTGQLPVMLQRAATQLGNDVQRRALQLAQLMEPLLIVVMGLVVMLIVLAVLLPIIGMNQLVR
ncbi:MAG: type II secretion system protein GspF [Rhodoferax sp.]|nr:type II secretion system protein GspF [Rhodoferax sp.]